MVSSLLLDIINEVAIDREVPETGTSREEEVEDEDEKETMIRRKRMTL